MGLPGMTWERTTKDLWNVRGRWQRHTAGPKLGLGTWCLLSGSSPSWDCSHLPQVRTYEWDCGDPAAFKELGQAGTI